MEGMPSVMYAILNASVPQCIEAVIGPNHPEFLAETQKFWETVCARSEHE